MRNLPNVYSSFCPGAPILNGTPGSFLEVIKACLVNGTTKVSFPNIVVANGIAKIMAVTEGQVFYNGSRIAIEGCDEPLLNVTTEVDSHNSTSFSFKTTVADGTYGGSIKINQPAAGWKILFSGTNEAVLVSGNLDSLGVCVKISDIGAYNVVLEFWENMTSLTTGTNKADLTALYDNNRQARIGKAYAANATPVAWWLIADNTNVHFANDRWDSGTITPTPDIFAGGYPTSWGEFEAFSESDKKNFYYSGPKCYASTANGTYDSTYAWSLGYFSNNTPSDTYMSGIVLTETLRNSRGWMKLFPASSAIPYMNVSVVSGGAKAFKASYKMRPNLLYTDYVMVAHGPQRNSASSQMHDPVVLGTIKETKFANNAPWGNTPNFSIDKINGKRYINLPIFIYYPFRSNTSFDQNNVGIMPFLIGESWGS
jgi:hypothetical protein